MNRGLKLLAALALLVVTGCAEAPDHALRAFCVAHAAGISQVLTTPEQKAAGVIVCKAVGLPLGTPG